MAKEEKYKKERGKGGGFLGKDITLLHHLMTLTHRHTRKYTHTKKVKMRSYNHKATKLLNMKVKDATEQLRVPSAHLRPQQQSGAEMNRWMRESYSSLLPFFIATSPEW